MQGRLLCIENNSNCAQNIRLKDVKLLIYDILVLLMLILQAAYIYL